MAHDAEMAVARKNDCRWLDRHFGNVCRNLKTHPCVEVRDGYEIWFEPLCKRCAGCGYAPITPQTPSWDGEDWELDGKDGAE